jgi:hypothetical protein
VVGNAGQDTGWVLRKRSRSGSRSGSRSRARLALLALGALWDFRLGALLLRWADARFSCRASRARSLLRARRLLGADTRGLCRARSLNRALRAFLLRARSCCWARGRYRTLDLLTFLALGALDHLIIRSLLFSS